MKRQKEKHKAFTVHNWSHLKMTNKNLMFKIKLKFKCKLELVFGKINNKQAF